MAPNLGEAGLAPCRIDRARPEPLVDQVATALRQDILAGRLVPGQRLPPTRTLAAELGVSRTTTSGAYDQLRAEGYLEATVGAGTFVAGDLPLPPEPGRAFPPDPRRPPSGRVHLAGPAAELLDRPLTLRTGAPRPFRLGVPALDQFPDRTWRRLVSRVARVLSPASTAYGEPTGLLRLRQAIAAHLHYVRGVTCDADQIIVVTGSQQGIDLLARTVLEPGDGVWVEDPGYPGLWSALTANRARLVPVPVDDDGLDVARGRRLAPRARLACVAPSHQYPTGAVLSAGRRLQLLEWAREADAWILEDDYDSEFRYEGRPLAPLKALDRDRRVVYVGTFSKILFPALRLGYLVAPPPLVEPLRRLRQATGRAAPILEQEVLARFLEDGHYLRHLRRMRTVYARRRKTLVAALARELGPAVRVSAAPAGQHLVLWLPEGVADGPLPALGEERGLELAALSSYRLGAPGPAGLVLGYGSSPEADLSRAAAVLGRLLRPHLEAARALPSAPAGPPSPRPDDA